MAVAMPRVCGLRGAAARLGSRIAVGGSVQHQQQQQHRRPARALHSAVAACAGGGGAHKGPACGEGDTFTVTTPLYYVNAGGCVEG